jgi:hypothetical protein
MPKKNKTYLHFLLEAISKIGFWFKVKAEPIFNPQAYSSMSRSWNEAPTQRLSQKTLLRWLLIACMFILQGCKTAPLPPSSHTPSDELFVHFLENNLGTDWYGIYLQESKIGYLTSTTSLEKGPKHASYRMQLSGTLHIPPHPETDEVNIQVVVEFRARPPYSLVRYSDRVIHMDEISEITITKKAEGYLAKITQGNETNAHFIDSLDFTLKDYTAVQRWITQKPEVGASIKYPYLYPETHALEETFASIKAIHTSLTAGVKMRYYIVTTTNTDGLEINQVYGADGKAYSIVLGGVFKCRLEPQSLATRMDTPINFFVKNTTPINQPLGTPENVRLLKLSVDNTSGAFLENAPGQSVTRNRSDKAFNVTLQSNGAPHISATEAEINNNLKATIDTPANHPKIIGLTRNAVGNAGMPAEKVNRLVQFVYHYIEDDYTANPLSTLDIIAQKKGDCSEHARLFTAMARSTGIPCRTVGGLVYLGDEFQGFGLHAWNEVVIDGVWIPVDPTWGQISIDATHIRFPLDVSKEWQVMAAIPQIKLTVLHVEHLK